MTIASNALSEMPLGAQLPGRGSKVSVSRPPSNRQIVAKSDGSAQPEPR